MGFLDAMMGNAGEVDPARAHQDFAQILTANEHVARAYVLIRDMLIFTNRRLIVVDKQGLTGHKVEYHSIPYKSITHFSIETAGHFDLDAELKIWISGNPVPFQKQFNKRVNIYHVQAVLADFVAR
ncbi:MAG TPA: PH domain-containing protein [Herpetosiphonaceae bacterium]